MKGLYLVPDTFGLPHAGRDFRLTDVHGSVVTELLAAARTGSGIASSEMTIQTRDIYDS